MLLLPMIDAELHPSRLLGVQLPGRANAGAITKFNIDTIQSYPLEGLQLKPQQRLRHS